MEEPQYWINSKKKKKKEKKIPEGKRWSMEGEEGKLKVV